MESQSAALSASLVFAALIQLFSLSYSNYIAEKQIVNSALAPVWLGKAKSTYLLLKSQSNIDSETKHLLNEYSFIEDVVITDRIQRKEKENVEVVKIKSEVQNFKTVAILAIMVYIVLGAIIVLGLALE